MEPSKYEASITLEPASIALQEQMGQGSISETELSPVSTFPKRLASRFRRLDEHLQKLSGFEARGITRVLPEERQPHSTSSDAQIALLWFSSNITCNVVIIGLYGPLLFDLGFLDSIMCAVLGAFLGSLSTGYMAIWGPKTGNRTSKNPILLQKLLGYTTFDDRCDADRFTFQWLF